MSFFAGIASGWGEAQGKHNAKMLEMLQEKNRNLATMYGHLADRSEDQDLAAEFTRRSMGWAGADPLRDPKGYKELAKAEKLGLHDLADQTYQRKVKEYQNTAFNVQPKSQEQPSQPQQQQQSATATPPDAFDIAAPPIGGEQPSQPGVPSSAGGAAPTQGLTPPPQATPQAPQAPPNMDAFVRSTLPPEPQMFGAMGRYNPDWVMWKDMYTKKMEGTVSTPQAMQSFVGAPFMPSGFASPYASLLRTDMTNDAAMDRAKLSANTRLYGMGAKIVNGQIIPLKPEEQSLVQQLKVSKDQLQMSLMAATIPMRQMMTEYYGNRAKESSVRTQAIPIQLRAMLDRLALSQQRLELAELNTNARIFGTDSAGNPIPGALAMDDGTGTGNMVPVGSLWTRNVLPTSATQGKAEMAVPVMDMTNKLQKLALDPANAELFGRVQGNMMEWLSSGKNMTNDPREGPLRADLISLASLMVPLHGFRSQKAAEEFLARLSQGMPLDGFIGSLKAFNGVGLSLYENAMPNLINAGGGASPRMPLPPGQAPSGDKPGTNTTPVNMVATEKDYRDAAMASGWDGLVKPVPPEIKAKAEALLRKQGKIR